MTVASRPPSDAAVNLSLGVLTGICALAMVLRGAGTIAAWLQDVEAPTGSWASGLMVLTDPVRPANGLECAGLDAILYWLVVALLLTLLGGAAYGASWVWDSLRESSESSSPPVGVAGRREVTRVASSKTLLTHAATLRPSLVGRKPTPGEIGYQLGKARGVGVWARVEDSMLLIGPPRSGKGLHVVINMIFDAPGPVITTSTRPDNLTVTLTHRERVGPVAVFDPQRLAPGLPAGLRWSPVRGCEDPLTAMIRAKGLASATGFGGVQDAGFWEGKTTSALQSLLHAAALDGRGASTLYQWATNPTPAADAVRILHSASGAAEGWADSLDSMLQADPRTRDSIWQGVSLALSSLADPRVLDSLSPRDGENFDPAEFLENNGTLYLLATGAGAGASASLVAAFVEDVVETARRKAAVSPGVRLDPPLLLALDEIGNLAPLPSLPTLMAEGGGSGITTLAVLQSLAQAREKWGDNNAGAIWDASIVKILLGGASNSRDLQDLSTLIGDRDEPTDTINTDTYGTHSSQRSIRRVPIMPPDQLRTLDFGTAIVMLRSARPIITRLSPWTNRDDAPLLTEQRSGVEETIRSHS